MKRVLHFKAGPYLPLTETWIYNQIRTLKTYVPVVYGVGTENLDVYPTKRVRSLILESESRALRAVVTQPMPRQFLFNVLFLSFLLRDRPVLTHAHFGPSGYSFLRFKKLFKIPLLTTFYGYDLNQLITQDPRWKERYRKLFDEGELFLVEGSHMKQTLTNIGCPPEKAVVQHLGVDLQKIPFSPRSPGTDGEIRVLVSASFREKKGIPYGIEAFARVHNACPGLNLKMTIIGDSSGTASENAEKEKIFDVVRRYRIQNDVKMLGYQPYSVFLAELFRHHIFLSPSVHASDGDVEGGSPVSIIEASASGIPVLSTTHCDIPEVILNGTSGYLVPERDVEALEEKLMKLAIEPSLWAPMGNAGRRHIEANYHIDTQGVRLEEIYNQATGTHPSRKGT